MRRAARWIVCLTSAALFLALTECREPTEITLELTTDVPCSSLQGVTVTVGRPGEVEAKAPGTITHTCGANGNIGSIVVIPTGSKDDEVAIKVVAGRGQDAESCSAPGYGPGCIVARRVLRYQPHTPLIMPIAMREICAGVACQPTETCVNALCKDAHISNPASCANPPGCDETHLPPVDGGVPDSSMGDAGRDAGARDTGAGVDAGFDAGADAGFDAGVDAGFDAGVDAGFDAGVDAGFDAGVDAACGNTSIDPNNCGQCNHSCLGGACVGGVCQPVVLASGQSGWGIAVDATNVYWTNHVASGSVMKMPIAGGAPTALATTQSLPTGIAVDSGNVYWCNYVNGGAVMKVAIGGGVPAPIATGQSFPAWIALDAVNAYWTNQNNNSTVMKVSLGGGALTPLASAQTFPWGIAVDANNVYWSDWSPNSVVNEVPIGGGTITALASALKSPFAVAVYGANVYYTTLTGGEVGVAPITGGGGSNLATGQGKPWSIAVDASGVYWTNNGSGTVMHVPLGGGAATTLASAQSGPRQITLDATSIYWVDDTGGTVMRLAK